MVGVVGVVGVVGKYSRSGRRRSRAVVVAEEAPLGTLAVTRSHIPKRVNQISKDISILKSGILGIWHFISSTLFLCKAKLTTDKQKHFCILIFACDQCEAFSRSHFHTYTVRFWQHCSFVS